jgi:hypothetical protein
MPRTPICGICNKPVELEISKTDELGKAVHESCYVLSVRRAPVPPGDESVSTAVVDFPTP